MSLALRKQCAMLIEGRLYFDELGEKQQDPNTTEMYIGNKKLFKVAKRAKLAKIQGQWTKVQKAKLR